MITNRKCLEGWYSYCEEVTWWGEVQDDLFSTVFGLYITSTGRETGSLSHKPGKLAIMIESVGEMMSSGGGFDLICWGVGGVQSQPCHYMVIITGVVTSFVS